MYDYDCRIYVIKETLVKTYCCTLLIYIEYNHIFCGQCYSAWLQCNTVWPDFVYTTIDCMYQEWRIISTWTCKEILMKPLHEIIVDQCYSLRSSSVR